ncbi:hypothetical protein BDQ17DRAFT_1432117 [Cyathus striatus]|nr:hypothetical protein BDQ17DRAFT_1432117 [Cyathus striatus]
MKCTIFLLISILYAYAAPVPNLDVSSVDTRQLDPTSLLGALPIASLLGGGAQDARRELEVTPRQLDPTSLLGALPIASLLGGGAQDGRRSLDAFPRQLDPTSLLGALPLASLLGGGAQGRRELDSFGNPGWGCTGSRQEGERPFARQDLNNLLNSLPIFGGDGATPSLDAQQPGELSSRQLLGGLLGEATDSTTQTPNVAARQDVAVLLDGLLGLPTDEDTRRRQLDVSTDLTGLLTSLIPLGTGTQEARDLLNQKLASRQLDFTDLLGNIFDGLSSRELLPRQILDPWII